MTDYKVYFEDNNIRIFGATSILSLINYLLFDLGYSSSDIRKIEKMLDN